MDELFLQWCDSLKAKQRKRSYQHLDKQLDLNNARHAQIVRRAIQNLSSHQFLPFLKFIKKDIRYRKGGDGVSKRSLKERPIMYASHLDAHIYSFFTHGWSQSYERYLKVNGIEESVIAYRKIPDGKEGSTKNKNNVQFAEEVFGLVQKAGDCTVIVADITKFFDSLNHKTLKSQMCRVLGIEELSADEYKILRSLTAYRYIVKDEENTRTQGRSEYSTFIKRVAKKVSKEKYSLPQAVYESGKDFIRSNKTTIGIPQGSPASGLLANIYLAEFDIAFKKNFPDVVYRRYSDDIVLLVPTNKTSEVFEFLMANLRSSQLDLNPSKAFLVEFHRRTDGSIGCLNVKNGEGTALGRQYLDYLGFEFNGETVLLRGKTLQRSYKKGDKKIGKFYARQTEKNPRASHSLAKRYRPKSGKGYIESAARTMKTVGSKIDSQQSKLSRFLRRKRRENRESTKNS